MSTLPPISSYPLVTPAVTKPRQLAPTVGRVPKGVTITGEAQRNMQHLAIGRVLINLQGEQIVDDSGWSPELDLVETGSIVPIGRINVFVGMVGTSSPALQYSDSVSEAGSMEQSEGEESVGTLEIETGNNTQGSGSEEQTRVPHERFSDDTESILELFEDRYGYEDDEFDSEPVPMRRVPVYTVPATNTNQERTLAVVSNPGGTAPSLAIREPLVPQQGSPVIQERRQVGIDGELASISSESEATARYMNT